MNSKKAADAAMAVHLRQICLVARHLASAAEDLEAVFALNPCHRDPAVGKFGLENTLWPVGSTFLEVVAPFRENTAAGRYLHRRGGNGGYMVITQVLTRAQQDHVRTRAVQNGVRIAHEHDYGSWKLMQLHPADMSASFFEVDWDERAEPAGNWMPAGGDGWQVSVCNDVVSDILAAELQSDDPDALAAHWGAVAGLPVTRRNRVPVVALANAELRFVEAEDGRGPGLGALDLRVNDRDRLLREADARGALVSDRQVVVCGMRFNLIE